MKPEKRLIWDADAQHRLVALAVKRGDDAIPMDMITYILFNESPTVDAVEVVHGRWERHLSPYSDNYWTCTCCNGNFMTDAAQYWKYCPNCGAKMDGDSNG